MKKIIKLTCIIFKSYLTGAVIIIMSGIILALWGVAIKPTSGTLELQICALILGLLAYVIKL